MTQALKAFQQQLQDIEQQADDIQSLQSLIARLPVFVQALLDDNEVSASDAEAAIHRAQHLIDGLQQKFVDEVELLGAGLKKIQKNRQSLAKYLEHNKAPR